MELFHTIWICYFLSLVWYFLLPLLSITTGELKPRKLYVDEHAFIISSIAQKLLKHQQTIRYSSLTNDAINNYTQCNFSDDTNLNGCVYNYKHRITSFYYDSPTKSLSNEALIIGIMYNTHEENLINVCLHVLFNILDRELWLAKRLIFILIPIESELFSSSRIRVDNWLSEYLDGTVQGLDGAYSDDLNPIQTPPVLIRQALILDLYFDTRSSYIPGKHDSDDYSHAITPLPAPIIHPSSTSTTKRWSHLELDLLGPYGLQPNMDAVTAFLSLNPHTILPSSTCTSEENILLTWLTRNVLSYYTVTPQQQMCINAYCNKLCGLTKFLLYSSHYSILMKGDGLHSSFLTRHIDSYTIRPVSPTVRYKLGQGGHNSEGYGLSSEDVMLSVYSWIHAFSNLHGMFILATTKVFVKVRIIYANIIPPFVTSCFIFHYHCYVHIYTNLKNSLSTV